MKEVFGVTFYVIVLAIGITFASFYSYQYFKPKYTAVDNTVFQQSQQYNEGMVRDLENIKLEYLAATPEQRDALRALAIHRFSVYPTNRLPPDLQQFYSQLTALN